MTGELRDSDEAEQASAAPAGPWHRRVFQSLLYGRNVDRARKARARLGLAMVGFAVIYAIIAGRLVMFAVAPDTRAARHGAVTDAVATARPDILDRNGEILATDSRRRRCSPSRGGSSISTRRSSC